MKLMSFVNVTKETDATLMFFTGAVQVLLRAGSGVPGLPGGQITQELKTSSTLASTSSPCLLFFLLLGPVQPIWMSCSVLQWECISTSRVGMQDLAHFFNLQPLLSSVYFLFWCFLLHWLPVPDIPAKPLRELMRFQQLWDLWHTSLITWLALSSAFRPYTPCRRKTCSNHVTAAATTWAITLCLYIMCIVKLCTWGGLLWWFYWKAPWMWGCDNWWRFSFFYWIT